ncbi:MAG TPA: hypothetical protein VKV26_03395 [Dehalococcoidia bacterium]|nr:hypothetical protein [Dehalococcoidia bacterium]
MSTQTPVVPARGAARRLRLPWWVAVAALAAFAAGLGIGIWQIHEHNSGGHHAVVAGSVAGGASGAPFVSDGAVDSVNSGAVVGAQAAEPRGGQAEAIDFGRPAAATQRQGVGEDLPADAATGSVTTSPALTVYLVASEDQRQAVQGELDDAAAIASANAVAPQQTVVVVDDGGGDTQADLQSVYPQFQVSVVDLRQP